MDLAHSIGENSTDLLSSPPNFNQKYEPKKLDNGYFNQYFLNQKTKIILFKNLILVGVIYKFDSFFYEFRNHIFRISYSSQLNLK